MLTPPNGLPEQLLPPLLATHWQLTATSLTYRPVGWGSHHWEVTDSAGSRWFLTVDELDAKRMSLAEPLDATFAKLGAALAAAIGLRDTGRDFVVAPIRTVTGAPSCRAGEAFSAALYPFVAGRSFDWGSYDGPAHRRAILDLLVQVHSAPSAVSRLAPVDDYAIPHLTELAAVIEPGASPLAERGPYTAPMSALLIETAVPVKRLLNRYHDLVRQVSAKPGCAVLTHGEPHSGNTMRTADGWRLIDWDTTLVAPPERDLWNLDPGDGSILAAYAEATGVTVDGAALELYRLRWDLADIAVDVDRFSRPHTGTEDDDQSWLLLRGALSQLNDGSLMQ